MARTSSPPDMRGIEKKIEDFKKVQWYQKWWGQALIAIIVGLILLIIGLLI